MYNVVYYGRKRRYHTRRHEQLTSHFIIIIIMYGHSTTDAVDLFGPNPCFIRYISILHWPSARGTFSTLSDRPIGLFDWPSGTIAVYLCHNHGIPDTGRSCFASRTDVCFRVKQRGLFCIQRPSSCRHNLFYTILYCNILFIF